MRRRKNCWRDQWDVLFYDCPTLAFATEREDDQADEEKDRLLAKSFSKDGRQQSGHAATDGDLRGSAG